MVAGLVQFLGTVNLLAYFSADLYFAFALSRLKADHPDIDEASDRSREGVSSRGYGNLEEGSSSHRDSGFGLGGASNANSDPITIVLRAAKDGRGSVTGEFSGLFSTMRSRMSGHEPLDGHDHTHTKQQLIHLAVIIASFGIPVFGLLQVFFPNSFMSWSMFDVPNWLGILAMVPALMIVIVYCARAVRISSFASVTKTQWLSMTWFRLDVTCLMAALFLVGWGDWFLALLWGIVAGYLAYCLLATERTLQSMVSNTQLMREEMGGGGNHPGGGITAGGGFSQGSGLLRETLNSHVPNGQQQQQQQYQEISGYSGGVGANSYGAAPTDMEKRQAKSEEKKRASSSKKDKKSKKTSTATSSRNVSDSEEEDEGVEMATR